MDIPTRQALPQEDYLTLLGASLCVFNSNNAFIIENVLNSRICDRTWHELMDENSGQLKTHVRETISLHSGDVAISELFDKIVSMRNRIVHSFQVTAVGGDQMLCTLTKKTHEQFLIDGEYLKTFIEKNQELSDLLYRYRESKHNQTVPSL